MQQDWINNNRETVKRISGLNLDSAHCERSRNRSGVTYKGDGNLWKPLPEGDPLPIGSRKSQPIMNKELMKKEGDWRKDWYDLKEKKDTVTDDAPQGKGGAGGAASASSAATYVDNGGEAEVVGAMIVDDEDEWNLVDPKVSLYAVPNPRMKPSEMGWEYESQNGTRTMS